MAIQVGDKFLEELERWQSGLGTAMARVAEFARRRIIARTLKGRDRFGRPFGSYNTQYAQWKGQSNVDLRLSGEMLGALQVQDANGTRIDPRGRGSQLRGASGRFVSQDDVRIELGFGTNARAAEKAFYHTTGAGRMPVRDFMGLEEIETEQAVQIGLQEMGEIAGTRQDIAIQFSI